jgi:hypothetical protein
MGDNQRITGEEPSSARSASCFWLELVRLALLLGGCSDLPSISGPPAFHADAAAG